jgi:hypothetical protein
MEQAISLQDTGERYLISIDKKMVEQEMLLKLLNRLRVEYLTKKADFDDDIEKLGEEIKVSWWANNKDRFLNPANE